MDALEEMYSQGEKVIACEFPCSLFFIAVNYLVLTTIMVQDEATWAFTVLAYIGKLVFGIVG